MTAKHAAWVAKGLGVAAGIGGYLLLQVILEQMKADFGGELPDPLGTPGALLLFTLGAMTLMFAPARAVHDATAWVLGRLVRRAPGDAEERSDSESVEPRSAE